MKQLQLVILLVAVVLATVQCHVDESTLEQIEQMANQLSEGSLTSPTSQDPQNLINSLEGVEEVPQETLDQLNSIADQFGPLGKPLKDIIAKLKVCAG